ncbi:MAG: hypothetical protein EPO00_08255, partial [Chloroflexota bacterium]
MQLNRPPRRFGTASGPRCPCDGPAQSAPSGWIAVPIMTSSRACRRNIRCGQAPIVSPNRLSGAPVGRHPATSGTLGTRGMTTTHLRRRARLAPASIAAVLLLTAAGGLLPLARPVLAASNCTTTLAPTATYSVISCLTAPTSGAVISGTITVTATFTYTGTPPPSPVRRAVFYLGDAYVLTDYSAPFTFTFDSRRFGDASTTLEVEAVMRDTGWVSDRASIPVTLNNGQASPPPNTNTFTPRSGGWSGSGPIVIAATGDGASGEADATSVSNRIAGWNPHLVLYLGDVYETGSPMEFDNWYGGPTGDYGRFRSITNPTVGNHEYIGTTAPGYTYYWDNVPNYYSYTIGSWHFISLDSTGTGQFNQTLPGTAQVDWLAADLAADTSSCTLVYFHHPVFSIGPQGNTTRLNTIWSMLADAGVDVVLTGHDHDYQRWVPLDGTGTPVTRGITEFVVGTGGHGIQNFATSDSRVAASFGTTPNALGALKLSLIAGSADYQFINVAGSVLDSGTISCGTVPGKPTGVTASGGNAQASVSWTAPSDVGGGPISGYTAKSSPGNKTCSTGGALNCTVTGLTNGTAYTFTVTATNGLGTGSPSNPSNSVTPATLPGAPTSVTATPGNASAPVSWTAPASNGGSAITGYAVTSSPGNKTCTTSGGLTCTVTGLTNGTAYTFTVTATNALGTSPPSSPSNSVTPLTVPGMPTGVVASGGNAQASVSWTAPTDMGGSPISGYTAMSAPGNKTCNTTAALNCTVTGLTNGTTYTFTVTATNGLGTGSPSNPSNSVIPATVPGAPTAVLGKSRDSAALISWAAPASNGGNAITGYAVTSSPGGKTCSTSGGLSCTVGGLANGTSYTFTVRATNGVGTGPSSSASNSVVPGPLVLRYAGADRFATAAAISANTFDPGVAVAYIANAYGFPDAL